MVDGYGGVGYYRIIQPSRHIKGHEVNVVGMGIGHKGETPEQKWTRIFTDYDVFWTTYFSNPQEASYIFYHRDKFKKKVIIDLDDNYLDVGKNNALYEKYKPTRKDRAFTSTILSFADAITVSTEPLKQKVSAHLKKIYNLEKNIFVIPNMNEIADWNYQPAEKNKDKFVIGYSGSSSHYDDLEMMLPALGKIMDKYPQVFFESTGAIGKKHIELFSCFSKSAQLRSDAIPSTWTFKEYPEHLSKMKWDIGIAPLIDDAFTRCKSHIKFMEYSMFKIPTIASRVYPYFVPCFGREVIEHEKTGLLVKPSEWFDALEDLILHKDKRLSLGQNAYEYIRDNWQYDNAFSDVIDKMLKTI
jgi:glycosyltransferase involved in cell wall biosynthesis